MLWHALGFLLSLCLGIRVRMVGLGAGFAVGAALLAPHIPHVRVSGRDAAEVSMALVSLGLLLMPAAASSHWRPLMRAVRPFLVICTVLTIGLAIGLRIDVVDGEALRWSGLFWLAVSAIELPRCSGFRSYRGLVPMDDPEASGGANSNLLASHDSSYALQVLALTFSAVAVQAGLLLLGPLQCLSPIAISILPLWALLCGRWSSRFAPPSQGLAFTAASLSVWVVLATLGAGHGGALGGLWAFLLQGTLALVAARALRLPIELVGPMALALCGQPVLAIAMPLLRGRPFLARCVVVGMPVLLAAHWALLRLV